ncbi:odorant receptor 45b-like [Cylas formicarius]|uniref:odorant receptor 45b-like n=1 Tax=Cylas formicarius TaxID=197179 RepID=UPI0029589691|nr:odorant receptor 45b-like [Cylas formicarius]
MRGQLKILQYYFTNFFENIVEKDRNGCFQELKFLCVKHQNLIEYINTANCAFKGVVFFEYAISSIVLATSIIQISVGGNVTNNLIHLFGVTSQLLLLAWYSDEIVFQSLELAPALYQSKWYECSKESRILISMMLMRCQKPLSIDIGSFGAMTIQSAMTVSIVIRLFLLYLLCAKRHRFMLNEYPHI